MKKDILIILLILVCLGLVVFVVVLLEKSSKVNKSLEEEKYSRMVTEESLQKNAAKITILENQLNKANEKLLKVGELIDSEKMVNVDLQKQYDELNKLKSDLENKLKATIEAQSSVTVDSVKAPIAQ